jgi:iron complex outermembrane receptor protein
LADGPINNDAAGETEAYAAFGQASYFVSPRFRVTLGGRYSHERKEATAYINNEATLGVREIESATWDAFTPRVSLDFFASDDVMLYLSATKGFKTGGFNGPDDVFDPEYIWSYETGLRSTFWHKRLRFNATAFYYDYTDIQFFQALSAPDPETGATTEVGNAASAEVMGLELELAVAPLSGLQIGLNAALLDATYKNSFAPNTEQPGNPIVDLSGNRLPQAPKFAGSLTASYSWPLGSLGTMSVQGDVYHQSRIYFSAFNEINGPYDQQREYELVNARIELESADGNWNVAVFGRNLGDTVYRQNVIRAIGFFGQLDLLAPPRTYGVQVGFNF